MRSLALAQLALVAVAWLGCSDDGGNGSPLLDGGVLDDAFEVKGGDYFAIRIAASGELVPDEIVDPYELLSATAAQAVDASPEWIQADLAENLSRMAAADADLLAEQILAAEEPWVDEVAWAIAITDAPIAVWMANHYGAPIFLENAEAIYAVDGLFDYAELVELDDGRTTLLINGEEGEYQLDPEIYYYYVVHPRSYLELPQYVQGSFWRSFFLEDDTYGSTLVDAVAGAQTIQEAADMVGDWLQGFMSFAYGTNFSQPVDIYASTIGSCGQYSIITNAIARTVLIPTATATARADDHEWNEFWDGRWIMWDNSLGDMPNDNPHYPYIDWPEIMDVDTGGSSVLGEVAHVMRFRPDDNVFASDLYTPYKQVEISVSDATGAPVEGARVIVSSVESGGLMCTWGYSDAEGRASLLVGDDLLYTFAADHDDLGSATALESGTSLFADDLAEEPIEDAMVLPLAYDRDPVAAGDSPGGALPVSLSFEVVSTLQHRENYITEPWNLGHTYPFALDSGVIDVYVTNAAGIAALEAGGTFDAWGASLAQSQGAVELSVPPGEDWYVVLDNTLWPRSDKQVSLSLATGNQP